MYVASGGSLFKSSDSGKNWSLIKIGSSNIIVGRIAIDPNNSDIIYIGTSDGIYKTTTGGT